MLIKEPLNSPAEILFSHPFAKCPVIIRNNDRRNTWTCLLIKCYHSLSV